MDLGFDITEEKNDLLLLSLLLLLLLLLFNLRKFFDVQTNNYGMRHGPLPISK